MPKIVIAEITRTTTFNISVDVEKYCEGETTLREAFTGTDEEFVKDFIKQEAWSLHDEAPFREDELGISAQGEYDEVEASIMYIGEY